MKRYSMLDQIFELLSKQHDLPDLLRQSLSTKLMCDQFKKNDKILRPGQIARHIWFIKSGLIRAYTVIDQKKEKERTQWFMKENDIAMSVESFLRQKPSDEYVQAVENTEVGYITYEDYQELKIASHPFALVANEQLEKYYALSTEHKKVLVKRKEERYKFFWEHHADFKGRLTDILIGTYLGLHNGTLSGIKRDING